MENFFNRYRDAFDAFDPETISSFYTLPCSTSDNDGLNVFSDSKSLINKLKLNCQSMKSMGCISSKFNILQTIDMGTLAKSIHVAWQVKTKSSNIEFRASYTLQKVEKDWRIFNVHVYPGCY